MIYNCEIEIDIEPKFCVDWPHVKIGLDDSIVFDGRLSEVRTFYLNRDLNLGNHHLWIQFLNKTNDNSTALMDQAVIIKNVKFEGLLSDRFKWAAKYYPTYPEPWASEQKINDIDLSIELINQDYLGWNGIWKLSFTVPVFTWIHTTDNLGLIYR